MKKSAKPPTSPTSPLDIAAHALGDKIGTIVGESIYKHGVAAIDRIVATTTKRNPALERVRKNVPAASAPATKAAAKAAAKTPKGKPAKVAKKAIKASPKATKAAPIAKAEKAAKRSPVEVDATAERLFKAIEGAPGNTMEQLSAMLHVPTVELTLPMQRLFGQNSRGIQKSTPRVRSTGQKRATRYFVAEATTTPVVEPEVAEAPEVPEVPSADDQPDNGDNRVVEPDEEFAAPPA